MREHQPECQDCAEVVYETGGENDLANFGFVETGLDHDRVNDCYRRGRERDSGYLSLRPGPTQTITCEQEDADIRSQKPHDADTHTGPKMLAHNLWVDLGSG